MMSTDGRMKQSFSLARGVSIHPIRFVRARSRRDARAYHFLSSVACDARVGVKCVWTSKVV